MKNILLHSFLTPLIVAFFTSVSFAQPKMAATVKADLNELMNQAISMADVKVANRHEENRYHLHNVEGEMCVGILAKVNSDFSVVNTKKQGIHIGTVIKDIVTLKVPIHNISNLFELVGVTHIDLAQKVKPLVDRIDYDTRLDSVKMAIDLPQTYTGKDVYIGIIDWGFDYTHPNYYDTLMENYRVAAAWDQFKTSGPHPQGFDYGTEYVGFDELQAAQSDTANIYSYAYHGGHVAGISAGGGAGTNFKGVAYEAELLFATFLIDVVAVLDAYEWMYQKAQSAGKRLVINQSWGLYHMGTLDGSSLLSEAIDNYSDLGVIFTSSAGNNGNTNFHLEKTFETNDTIFSGIAFSTTSSPHFWGQSITAWGTEGVPFEIGFDVFASGQQLAGESVFYSSSTTTAYVDTFLTFGSDTVFYNLAMEDANPFNNRPHARLRVKRTTPSLNLVLKLAANQGTVHAWNVAELTTDVGNMGTAFTSFGPNSVSGDSYYGVGEPGCTESVIAVASHQASFLSPLGNLSGGTISSFSSYGPLYNGTLKPDLSAPGSSIASSISSFTDASTASISSVEFNGRTYTFSRLSGTSMSSPVVAGIVALMLEANPSITAAEVKTILIATAYTDDKTGEIGGDGDTRWGWGKVDAYNAIKEVRKLTAIASQPSLKEVIIGYPNPTTGFITFENVQPDEMVYLFNQTGQLIANRTLTENTLDLTSYSEGTYLIKLASTNQVVRVVKR